MTSLLLLGCIVAGLCAGGAADSGCTDSEFRAWMQEFKQTHHENAGAEERALRMKLFCRTKRVVEEHNAKYDAKLSTFFMRVNEFAAHTKEERASLFGTIPTISSTRPSVQRVGAKGGAQKQPVAATSNNVSAVDWRKSGKVSSIKNQGQCGSCWAFSAIGAIEGAVSIAEGFKWNTSDVNEGYSVDQCLECTPGTFGCQGGYPWLCFDHIISNGGIDSERDWPYLSDDCNAAKEKFEKVASILSYKNISDGDEAGLRSALVLQPVSVSIRANCDAFMSYGGGVLDEDCGGGEQQIDHSVLAVGYDVSAKEPYYIVKNSWGEGWGEDGYVRMKIGDNLDCIACKAVYPQAGPKPPKPEPEVQCKSGTYDPNEDPTSCPQSTSCCCKAKKFWKPKECKATECCMGNQVCKDGHGCQSS